jgi:hypothetical protein
MEIEKNFRERGIILIGVSLIVRVGTPGDSNVMRTVMSCADLHNDTSPDIIQAAIQAAAASWRRGR